MKGNEKTKHTKSGKKHFRKIDLEPATTKIESSQEEYDKQSDNYTSLDEIATINDNLSSDGEEKQSPNEVEIIGEKIDLTEKAKDEFRDLQSKINNILMTESNSKVINLKKKHNFAGMNDVLFEYDQSKYKYKRENFISPYESLNPGKWLYTDTLENCIQSLIIKFDLTDSICILGSHCVDMIIRRDKETCLR